MPVAVADTERATQHSRERNRQTGSKQRVAEAATYRQTGSEERQRDRWRRGREREGVPDLEAPGEHRRWAARAEREK